jgi:hypothetical protein
LLIQQGGMKTFKEGKEESGRIRDITAFFHTFFLVIEKGAIARLIDLLCQIETSEVTKERIACILANLALCSKASKREIAEKGGITPLVELFYSGTPKAQKNAVCAVMNVLVEDENIALCHDRVVESLIGLLMGSDDKELKKHAAGSLANMATDVDKKKQIVEKGGVHALVEVLQMGDVHAKGHAAGALMNIVEGDDVTKLQIAKLEVVEPLVYLLQNGTTAGKVRALSLLFDFLDLNDPGVNNEINQPFNVELVEDVVTNGSNVESQCAEPLLYLLRARISNPTISSTSTVASPTLTSSTISEHHTHSELESGKEKDGSEKVDEVTPPLTHAHEHTPPTTASHEPEHTLSPTLPHLPPTPSEPAHTHHEPPSQTHEEGAEGEEGEDGEDTEDATNPSDLSDVSLEVFFLFLFFLVVNSNFGRIKAFTNVTILVNRRVPFLESFRTSALKSEGRGQGGEEGDTI